MSHRDPRTGRFMVAPGKVPQPRPMPDRTLITDQRRVLAKRCKAIGDMLRGALRQQGYTLTATLDLEVLALARIATNLEVMTAEQQRGVAISSDQLVRMSNALSRGLARLGLRPTLLEPAKPPPNLVAYLADKQQRPAS